LYTNRSDQRYGDSERNGNLHQHANNDCQRHCQRHFYSNKLGDTNCYGHPDSHCNAKRNSGYRLMHNNTFLWGHQRVMGPDNAVQLSGWNDPYARQSFYC
jgi:hypothetical protein